MYNRDRAYLVFKNRDWERNTLLYAGGKHMKNYSKIFAKNLRALRVAAGMTQKELATAAGYSEKTVSKWECAAGIPDIGTLYEVAAILKVGLESLFREDGSYLLAIDGGGTKTALILADREKNILREYRTGPCNPMDIGFEESKKRLREAIYRITEGIALSSIVMFAGIAGGTSGGMRESFREFFREFGFHAYQNDSDNMNIVAAGLGTGNGISVIMGTGICAYAQKDGKQSRAAGWGYLFDDGGCAYNVGRDGIAAHFRSLDGTGPKTLISELLYRDEDLLKKEPRDTLGFLGTLYAGGKKKIASYAPVVYRAAERGDAVAEGIVRRNMAEAARVIEAAAKDMRDPVIPVVLAGGLTKEPTCIPYLNEALHEPHRFSISALSCEPVFGALDLAERLMQEETKL